MLLNMPALSNIVVVAKSQISPLVSLLWFCSSFDLTAFILTQVPVCLHEDTHRKEMFLELNNHSGCKIPYKLFSGGFCVMCFI